MGGDYLIEYVLTPRWTCGLCRDEKFMSPFGKFIP